MNLTDLFIDIFVYVNYCVETSTPPGCDRVKAEVLRLVDKSEASFGVSGFQREEYDLARFAVIAWVDETIMASTWGDKARWGKMPLQRQFYQTATAGTLFFEKLNSLGPHQNGVREVYYLCLSMGFMGQYCGENDKYLIEQLKISNLKVLTGSSVGIPSLETGLLFPDAYPKSDEVAPVRKTGRRLSWVDLIAFLVPPVIAGGVFFLYHFVLANLSDNVLMLVK